MLGKAVMPRLHPLVRTNVRGAVRFPETLEHLAILGDCAWRTETHIKLPSLRRMRVVSRGDAIAVNDFVGRHPDVLEFSCVARTSDDSAFVVRSTPFEGGHFVCLRSRRFWIKLLQIR